MRYLLRRIFKSKPATALVLTESQTELQQALTLHETGEFARAQAIYEDILKKQPKHPEALYLLGMLAAQTNNLLSAKKYIGMAIEINPSNTAFHINYGNVLKELNQLDAALASYDQAIALDPDYADAHSNRGTVLCELKQFDAALASYNQAVKLDMNNALFHFNRGIVLHELKQPNAALTSYNKAIALKPDYAEAYSNRGIVLKELKKPSEALASYDKAIAIRPDYAMAHFNRGVVLQEFNQSEAALASYDKAIALKADYAEAYLGRGAMLHKLGQLDMAIASYDRAITLNPNYAEAYANRGVSLKETGQLNMALASYNKAIALKPDYAEAYSNRGNTLKELNQLNAALESYDKAIALNPDHADAHYNKALTLLLCGDFSNGWNLYEWRWKSKQVSVLIGKRDFTQPTWLGQESLAGKTILLHGEQGYGDIIQFCRYAKLVADLGARVILEIPKPLLNLLSNLEGVAQLIQTGEQLPEFDYHCPLLSLPLAFKTNIMSIPFPTKYLSSNENKVKKWQAKLGEKTKPRVGIVWSSTSHFNNDSTRSIPFSEFAKALPKNEFEFICLQKEIKEADKESLESQPDIRFFGNELVDFSDTAALIECVDVVVSTCTSVPHLSCALGKPTWILLSHIPDWRWLLNRTDSPWYSSAKLYRQNKTGDWDGVLKQVKTDLIQFAHLG